MSGSRASITPLSAAVDPAAVTPGLPSDVLALTGRTECWSPAVTLAVAFASRWRSQLTGCLVEPADDETDPTRLPLPPVEHPLAADFSAFAAERNVATAQWMVARGRVAPVLQRLGAWHDLIVIDRGIVDQAVQQGWFGEVMLGCRRPCLIPPAGDMRSHFEHVAIGWNGSIEATRSMHAAMPLLRDARQVWLFDGSPKTSGDGLPCFDPGNYLDRHRIAWRKVAMQTSASGAGEALLYEAGRVGSDLLVMGGYSHSAVRDRVLGGATRHVLGAAPMAVFMQH